MRKIVFFTDSLANHSGGMEVHQDAFINFFSKENVKLLIITKSPMIQLYSNGEVCQSFPSLLDFSIWLRSLPNDTVVFFNNLSWIKQTPLLKQMLPNSKFFFCGVGEMIFLELRLRMTQSHFQFVKKK